MVEGCPPDETLHDFAAGRLQPAQRDAVAAHVGDCPKCGPKLSGLSAVVGAHAPTQFDSPAAQRRRVSTKLPQVMATPIPSDGAADTVLSAERGDPGQDYGRGATLNRYVVIDRLGRGGMGEVYAAYDPDLDRKVAVKLLRQDFAGTEAADELRVRLLREAQAMARVAHPNVVAVHDVGLLGAQVFIAMEFVDGRTVTDWLKSKPRGWSAVLDVFIQAGQGLAAAHAMGLTHRDFKPENVVVGNDKRVRVMDFGLVHAHDEAARVDAAKKNSTSNNPEPEEVEPPPGPDEKTEPGTPAVGTYAVKRDRGSGSGAMSRRITQPGTQLGTPAYMSLEQLEGRPTDPRSDQFSFCVALYEALYGERPFAGDTGVAVAVEIAQNRVRPAPRDSLVPARIRKLVLRGLRAKPEERFRSMEALLIGLSRKRSAVVRQYIAIGATAVVAITLAAAVVQSRRTTERCATIAQRFDGVWDESTRAAAKQAFLSVDKPFAAHAWQETSQRLDQWTQRWVAERTELCRAHVAVDEQLGEQLLCLGRAYADAAAVAKLLPAADAELVERSVPMVLGLPRVESCRLVSAATSARPGESDEVLLALGEARALLEAGRLRPAFDAAQSIVTAHAGDPAVIARGELLKGQSLTRQGALELADTALLSSVLNADAARADEVAARAWTERVGVAGMRRLPEAETYARFARAAIDRAQAPAEVKAALTNNQGVVAYSQGRYTEAADFYFKAAEQRRAALGQNHPLVARSLSNLGAALKAGGKPAEAVSRYHQALSIEEATLDKSHPSVADTLNNLGNALADSGDRPGALAALRRSLEIKQQAYGPQSLSVAISLTNLGAVLLETGELDEAEKVLRQSLQIKEASAGADSLTVAVTLTNLATVERRRGTLDEALTLARRALKVRTARQGPEHVDLALNLTQEGQLLTELKQPAEAIAPLERAHALRTAGSASLKLLGETDLALARALAASKKDLGRAKALAEQVASTMPSDEPLKGQAETLASSLSGARSKPPRVRGQPGSAR